MPQCFGSDTPSAASLLLQSMIFMLNRADILHVRAECSGPDNVFGAWRLLSGIMHSIAAAVFGALVHVLSTACACAE